MYSSKRNIDEIANPCHKPALVVKMLLPYFLGVQLNSRVTMIIIGPSYIFVALDNIAGKARITSCLKKSSS
jgi:hypothetical protein